MKNTLGFIITLLASTSHVEEVWAWNKHIITECGRTNTAVAGDFDGDGDMDVISGYPGTVSLFLAPDWEELVLHRFANPKGNLIHSEVIDVDGDGDMDWAGAQAKESPFWLENPGNGSGAWAARIIDHDIRGIHCLLKAEKHRRGQKYILITARGTYVG